MSEMESRMDNRDCHDHDVEDGVLRDSDKPVKYPSSHLPSWVLKMREKITISRNAHADTELRIEQLNKNMDSLSAKLLVMKPKLNKNEPNCVSTIGFTSNKSNGAESRQKELTRKGTPFYSVPSDVFIVILEYLRVSQILNLDIISRTFQAILATSPYWNKVFPIYCPHLTYRLPAGAAARREFNMKALMQEYLKSVKICTSFIHTMKAQRSVPKHRTVQPHRHSRHERQVTHPLPIFDQESSSSGRSGIIGNHSSASSRYSQQEYVMSHAETLSSDFRSVAHRALETLHSLTSDVEDPVIYKLVGDGAVTVLAALLNNEEGALQNYACGILANLLCWEARKLLPMRGVVVSTSHRQSSPALVSPCTAYTLAALFGMSAESVEQLAPLALQLKHCDGIKMLTGLLTSPTASINLAVSSNRDRHSDGLTTLSANTNTNTIASSSCRNTSSVQGMCNKQASRALATLLYPAMPVPNPATAGASISVFTPAAALLLNTKRAAAMHISGTGSSGNAEKIEVLLGTSTSPSKLLLLPLPQQQLSTHHNHLPTPLDVPPLPVVAPLPPVPAVAVHEMDYALPIPHVVTAGIPPPPALPVPPVSSSSVVREKLRRGPVVGELFTSDTFARPWLFTYFYKSGSIKDQFTTYLRFLPSSRNATGSGSSDGKGYSTAETAGAVVQGGELRGRGIDNIGAFLLTGRAEADITGWSWYFHKSYVRLDAAALEYEYLRAAEDGGGVGVVSIGTMTPEQWVQMIDLPALADENINNNTGGGGSGGGVSGGVGSAANGTNSLGRAPTHVSHVGYWSAGVEDLPPVIHAAADAGARSGAKAVANNAFEHQQNTAAAVAGAAAASSASATELDAVDESASGAW